MKSLSYQYRSKRMRIFEEYVIQCFGQDHHISILDMGGTMKFWDTYSTAITQRAEIIIVNLKEQRVKRPNFSFILGNVCDLSQFEDMQFDLVFSNSVIEHVGNFNEQKKMATEIKRLGKRHFIQTPNRAFPFEPHFLFPLFQFLPRLLQVFLVTHFKMGYYKKAENKDEALKLIDAVNLLGIEDMHNLFNESDLLFERIFGMKKSIIALK